MKKQNALRRILSLTLMLVMLGSLAAVGVCANENPRPLPPPPVRYPFTPLFELFVADKNDPLGSCSLQDVDRLYWNEDHVISVDDFEAYIQPFTGDDRDITLELAGIKEVDLMDIQSEEEFLDAINPIKDLVDSLHIPPFPMNGTMEEREAWINEFAESYIYVTYVNHRHNLAGSPFYFDDNYHWQLCTECSNRVYLANHTDKDNDGKCDFCGNAIRYYNVTVKDTTGGKVTLSADKGAMNDKITVTVTPDAGYHLEKLNLVNANAMHSKRAVWEDTPNAEYHFFIANWDVEVEAVFVKD